MQRTPKYTIRETLPYMYINNYEKPKGYTQKDSKNFGLLLASSEFLAED